MASSLITSYQLKSSAQGTTPLVTPSFTPTNGEVITVTWETFDPTITMTITNSGSQTIAQKQLEQPGGFNGTCGISAGTISGSPGSMTITGTPSASARYSMTVERWAGSQLAGSPVVNGNTSTAGPIQSTLTPTGGAGGVIVWVGQDSQSVDPSTRTYAGSGTDDGVRDDHVGSNGVGYHGYQTITGNTSQTYGLTAPTGVVKWVIAGLEVQPAAAAASPPPPFAARRRLQVPRRRTVAGSAIKTQVVTAPAFPPQSVRQPRRLRGLAPRRGRTFGVIPPQVIVQAPAIVPSLKRLPVRGLLRTLRSRGATVIPTQVIVTAPAYIPPSTRFTIRRLRLFRARNAGVPQPQTIPSVPSGRARLKLPKFFRGSTTQTPAVPVVVTAPTYLPPVLRARTRLLRLSRGRTAAVIPPQVVAPTPPAYVAPSVRSGARLLRWFRPAGTQTPIAQVVAPTPPAYVPPGVRIRARLVRLSRGRTAALIPAQAAPPASAGRVRIRGLFSRRVRSAQVIPPQVTAVAPTYVPPVVRTRVRGAARPRRRGAQVVPPQVVPAIPPPYVAPFARALRRGLKLFRPRAFQVPANGQAAPVIPVVPPVIPAVPANGWNGLQGIMRSIRSERTRVVAQPVRACPHDGEPLRTNRWGMLFCQYDGWQPEGQVDVRTGTGDWGGLRAIKEGAQREKDIYTSRPVLACPHDGEPLSISRDGIRFCKFDGWQPPNQNVTG